MSTQTRKYQFQTQTPRYGLNKFIQNTFGHKSHYVSMYTHLQTINKHTYTEMLTMYLCISYLAGRNNCTGMTYV